MSSQMLPGLGKWNLLPSAFALPVSVTLVGKKKKWFSSFLCQDSKAAWEKKNIDEAEIYPAHPGILQFCLSSGDFILTEKLENHSSDFVVSWK